MAVPDWPNTYGYNMFFFPISSWVGGIFYEHTHRLVASGVGLLTTILALWLYGRSARQFLRRAGQVLLALALATVLGAPQRAADALVLGLAGVAGFGASHVWPRCEPSPRWLRRLGLLAFFAVVVQSVLGGLRVTLIKDELGIFHATLAQLFFGLTCALALFTSRWWSERVEGRASSAEGLGMRDSKSLNRVVLATTLLIVCQLILGATMRHQHAGLAIPDFPLAYGKLWPRLDAAAVAKYNQERLETTAVNAITASQVVLQMAHRVVAVLILGAVSFCAWRAWSRVGLAGSGLGKTLRKLTLAWLGLIVAQVLLGAATIWSRKAADIATLHVLVGAGSLALGGILSIISFRATLGSGIVAQQAPSGGQPVNSPLAIRPAHAGGTD
jgi:cytochrome c oxidase assembly protein subunit 15